MRLESLIGVCFVVLGIGCRADPLVDGPAATVVVYGRVSASNGAAPPPALMSVTAHVNASCANPVMDAVNAVTSSAGDYRAILFNWGTDYSVCVSVHAAPPAESGFRASSEQLAPVRMRSDRLDSVRVDLELPPAN